LEASGFGFLEIVNRPQEALCRQGSDPSSDPLSFRSDDIFTIARGKGLKSTILEIAWKRVSGAWILERGLASHSH